MKPRPILGRRGLGPATATAVLAVIIGAALVVYTSYLSFAEEAFPGFERAEVTTIMVSRTSNLKTITGNLLEGSGWIVSVTLENTGTKEVNINHVSINDKPIDAYGNIVVSSNGGYVKTGPHISIPVGGSRKIFIALEEGEAGGGIILIQGLLIKVQLKSSLGSTYTKLVTLN